MNARWTKKEIDYLRKQYKHQTSHQIAVKIGRTENAILKKAERLGLSLYRENCEFLSGLTLCNCFGIDMRVFRRWYLILKMPAIKKIRGKSCMYLIETEKFWCWAKQHQELIPWDKYEEYSLLPEPQWVKDKIKKRKS